MASRCTSAEPVAINVYRPQRIERRVEVVRRLDAESPNFGVPEKNVFHLPSSEAPSSRSDLALASAKRGRTAGRARTFRSDIRNTAAVSLSLSPPKYRNQQRSLGGRAAGSLVREAAR